MLNYYLNNRSNFFDELFEPMFNGGDFSVMHTNISEDNTAYLFEVELPGYSKDEVKLSLKNGYLKVEATKNSEETNENESERKYIRREIYKSAKSRSFYVGRVDQSLIKAQFNNGILEISVPKAEKEEQNEILID